LEYAVGDLHGDYERTQSALQLAGVLSMDGHHRWIGGTTVQKFGTQRNPTAVETASLICMKCSDV